MKRRIPMLSVFFAATVAIILTAAATEGWAKEQIPFEDFRIRFEFNSTDNDLGIQIDLNGDPWSEVKCTSPNGPLFELKGKGLLRKFGLTELFWESTEPPLSGEDAVPVEDILATFPAGDYTCLGKAIENAQLVSTATLTHAIPAGPVIVSPPDGQQVTNSLVITWNPVTTTPGGDFPNLPVKVVAYQVIVADDFQVTVPAKTPPQAQSVTVTPEFVASLEPGEHEIEVLAIEEGGNQTITAIFFEKVGP
jgi:hypothetical protein